MTNRRKVVITALLGVFGFWGFTESLVLSAPHRGGNFWQVTLFFGVLAVCAGLIAYMWSEK